MPAAMPASSWSWPERRRHVLDVDPLELHRQRAVVDELGEVGGLAPGEVARDHRGAAERRERLVVGLDLRRRLHEPVEDDRHLLVELLLGERVPLGAAGTGEVHLHRPALARDELRLRRAHGLAREPRLARGGSARALAPPGLFGSTTHTSRLSLRRVVVGMVVSAATLVASHEAMAALASASVAGGGGRRGGRRRAAAWSSEVVVVVCRRGLLRLLRRDG